MSDSLCLCNATVSSRCPSIFPLVAANGFSVDDEAGVSFHSSRHARQAGAACAVEAARPLSQCQLSGLVFVMLLPMASALDTDNGQNSMPRLAPPRHKNTPVCLLCLPLRSCMFPSVHETEGRSPRAGGHGMMPSLTADPDMYVCDLRSHPGCD